MSSPRGLFFASLLVDLAVAMPGAMPWMGPMPTPMGLMASAGMSPRPTDAPGSNGVPVELRRRQNVQYPPPDNWCGFVEGHYDNPLSCGVGLTCVNSLDAIGCCTATTGSCTNLYTTCANYGDTCDRACQMDPAIRKCDVLEPYCGTYSFPGFTYLYNCDVTSALEYSMEYLNDYYVTAIGSTLASETTDPFGYGATVEQVAASTASATSTSSSGSTFASTTTDNSSSHGLSLTAIDGIAAGISVGGVLILGLIAFFCVRQRKRRRLAAASVPFQNTAQPQPMQQQPMQPAVMQQQEPQGLPPKAFDGYQAVAQQEQAPQYTQYPSPPSQSQPQPQQPQQQQTGYFPPPSAASAISPQTTGASDPRLSTANNTLLSPASDTSTDHRQSSYKTPVSPTVTEVDGTMGNPGVPHGGHGIAGQTQPGGSPSAQEIDGRVGASMTGPSEHEGPFELGHREGR